MPVPNTPARAWPAPPRGPTGVSSFDPVWVLGQGVANRVSGMLKVARSGVERGICFEEGRIIFATSNVPEELIGRILIARGVLGPEELNRFLVISARSGVRIAELLVKQGVLTARERQETVENQYLGRVLATFAWPQAEVQFNPGPAPAEEIPIPLPAGKLLLEGMRTHYDAARLEQSISAERVLTRVPAAESRIRELGFDPEETAAFLAVDGTRPVSAVAPLAADRAATLRALYAGICLNLLV